MAAEAKFHDIAQALRDQIREGTLQAGSRLPAEAKLAGDHNVAINTVRAAIRQLAAEGLVVVRPKQGAFVREYQRMVRDSNDRLSRRRWGSGLSIQGSDVKAGTHSPKDLTVAKETAPRDVADALGTDDVWVRRRTYLVDGKPAQRAVSYLPADIVEGSRITEPDSGPGGTYARLAELGFPPDDEYEEEFVARMPEASEADALELLPMTPVVAVRRIATSRGRVVEVNDMLCAADRYIFHVRFTAS
jgi:GntR family transcriptional regulator